MRARRISAWRAADPEVAFVLRGVIKNVEEACESESREQREAARIEREVAAVVRRLVSRVEHTSSEFEALVGGEEYERDQLAKLDTFLTSLGASPGPDCVPGVDHSARRAPVWWHGWRHRLVLL